MVKEQFVENARCCLPALVLASQLMGSDTLVQLLALSLLLKSMLGQDIEGVAEIKKLTSFATTQPHIMLLTLPVYMAYLAVGCIYRS